MSNFNRQKLDQYLRQDLDGGWIDAQGQFWGLSPGHHGLFITRCFRMYMCGETEKDNWIAVFHEHKHGKNWLAANMQPPNEAQAATMRKIGLDPETPFTRSLPVPEFISLYPNGYDDHKLPESAGELDNPKPAAENPIPNPS